MAITNHLNILLNYEEDMIVQTESLRNIVNKLNELWVICGEEYGIGADKCNQKI